MDLRLVPVESDHPCQGFPEGHGCPVRVTGRLFCSGCLRRRQEFYAAGLPDGPVAVGIILQDFEALQPECLCTGDANAPGHELSLLHAKWSWQNGQAQAQPVDWLSAKARSQALLDLRDRAEPPSE